MIKEVKICLVDFSQRYLNLEKSIKLSELPESQICEKSEGIFDIIWGLNQEVIEFFGCELCGEDYSHYQKSLQMFLSCFSEFKLEESVNGKTKSSR
jgi:hypothetical protein